MGFKMTFSWNGNTSRSRCCTTSVWNVKNLLSVYIHVGMWKPSCCCSCCCGKPLCTEKVYHIIQLLQRLKRYCATERRACWWRCSPARPVPPTPPLLSWAHRLFRWEAAALWWSPGWRTCRSLLDHPWSTSWIPLASTAAKSSTEKLALWTCGQQRRRGEM